MKRRAFITLLGGAAAWPLAARAQRTGVPLIGYLSSLGRSDRPYLVEAFQRGLSEAGYAEGRNVTIEYRFADNRLEQLEPLAADLIARKVAVIAAVGGNNTALVAKRLTSTIPILFTSGLDPVKAGLVASLNRPGANVTGVSWFSAELGSKHLEVLNELVPQATLIAILVNSTSSRRKRVSARSDGGCSSSKLARRRKSTPRLRSSRSSAPTPCSSRPIRSTLDVLGNLQCWRRGTWFQCSRRYARSRQPADCSATATA